MLSLTIPTIAQHSRQEPPARPARHPDTRTSYDILNHVPKEKAHSVALIYPDGEGPEVLPQRVVTVEGGKKPHSHLRRDVDVLSNRCVRVYHERVPNTTETVIPLCNMKKKKPC